MMKSYHSTKLPIVAATTAFLRVAASTGILPVAMPIPYPRSPYPPPPIFTRPAPRRNAQEPGGSGCYMMARLRG